MGFRAEKTSYFRFLCQHSLTLSFINASPVIDICGERMASKQIVASMLVLPRKNANLQRSTTAISRPSQSSARPLQGTIAVNMWKEFQRKNVKNRGIEMATDGQPKGLIPISLFWLFNTLFLTLHNKIFRFSRRYDIRCPRVSN